METLEPLHRQTEHDEAKHVNAFNNRAGLGQRFVHDFIINFLKKVSNKLTRPHLIMHRCRPEMKLLVGPGSKFSFKPGPTIPSLRGYGSFEGRTVKTHHPVLGFGLNSKVKLLPCQLYRAAWSDLLCLSMRIFFRRILMTTGIFISSAFVSASRRMRSLRVSIRSMRPETCTPAPLQ